MVIKLYMTLASPPVRAVIMCAKAINLELKLVDVDLMKGDHLKPEYLKLNPLHTVPVLDDNGFVLTDSHAIMVYLIDTYAKDKSLYPDDTKKRACINQMLHFDSGTLFPRHLRLALAVLMEGVKVVPEQYSKALDEAFGYIEIFLQNNKYIAGDSLSIADLNIFASITNASVLVPLDEVKYPNIKRWKKLFESLPYYNIHKEGLEIYKKLINEALSK